MMDARQLRELLTYDRATGIFTWLKSPCRNTPVGKVAGTLNKGRPSISIRGKVYRAHRLAWLHAYGEWPTQCIDHIDGNPANNAISNLRDVSVAVNMQNRRNAASNNSSGLLGAMKNGEGHMARIRANGVIKYLGTFPTALQAHEAYLKAKRELHEGCTI